MSMPSRSAQRAGTTIYNFEPVPEPASLGLAAVGLLGLAGYAVAGAIASKPCRTIRAKL